MFAQLKIKVFLPFVCIVCAVFQKLRSRLFPQEAKVCLIHCEQTEKTEIKQRMNCSSQRSEITQTMNYKTLNPAFRECLLIIKSIP